ncbi:Ketosteroid isomerase-related protein [Pseudonocardia thermophila]|uniref:Ketosteroid isomerase-related protein n=1 Tax=Pseudonocardia thermophila TaxID=1848 RepID=A0A1M7AF62_PSETH|nr:nuclear transport factor 2 family protein [Pseudonocardia thermophila]SHL41277.1 Ketosteroid isomerase-related protein [Pseudonocardia thermophila]
MPELYAPDAVVIHPLGPVPPLRGREALRAHFAAADALPLRMRAEEVAVHETADPEVVIGEFRYVGRNTATGRDFVAHNVFVVRVRDGLIVESRDYVDHLGLAIAGDRADQLVAARVGALTPDVHTAAPRPEIPRG